MNQNLILRNQVADLGIDGKPVEAAQRKTGSSDSDDAVLVETGGPAQDQGAKKRKAKKAGAT